MLFHFQLIGYRSYILLNKLKELHGLGARRTAVTSAPPLGCLPSQRSLAGGTQRECAEGHNEAAKLFNFKLSSRLDSLNANFPQAKFVYVDIYKPLLDLIQNPQKSGNSFDGYRENLYPLCSRISALFGNLFQNCFMMYIEINMYLEIYNIFNPNFMFTFLYIMFYF